MRNLGVLVIAVVLVSGSCRWVERHPFAVMAVPTVIGGVAANGHAEDLSVRYNAEAITIGALGGAIVAVVIILGNMLVLHGEPHPPAECEATGTCPWSGGYEGGDEGGEGWVDPGVPASADRPETPVLFDQTYLEPTFSAGTDEVWVSSSGTSSGVGDRPIHHCAEAKRLASDYLRANCPSIRTVTSHLRAYRIYAAPCTCSYSAGSTYCHAEVEGVCAIDGSSTAAFAYATAVDRGLAETLSWKNAERSIYCAHPNGSAVMGCAFEDNEWVCFGRTECAP